jgi:hypothetical protein
MKSAAVGQQVLLTCESNKTKHVEWWFRNSSSSLTIFAVVVANDVVRDFRDRIQLRRAHRGSPGIIIQGLTKSDAGIYTCAEKMHLTQFHSIVLDVEGKNCFILKCNLRLMTLTTWRNFIFHSIEPVAEVIWI